MMQAKDKGKNGEFLSLLLGTDIISQVQATFGK